MGISFLNNSKDNFIFRVAGRSGRLTVAAACWLLRVCPTHNSKLVIAPYNRAEAYRGWGFGLFWAVQTPPPEIPKIIVESSIA